MFSSGSGLLEQKPEARWGLRLRDDLSDEQTRRCSAVALAYWSKNLKPDGMLEYVLLEVVTSVGFIESPSFCFHENFKAKPKYDHSAEAELFFAELKGNIYKKKAYKVTNVCALGSSDSAPFSPKIYAWRCKFCSQFVVTLPLWLLLSSGLNGCKACISRGKEDLPIHHAEEGFNVGHRVNTIG